MVPKLHALTLIFMHELIRPERTTSTMAGPLRGGLPAWQQKRVMEFIEEHLAEEISLAALAELADLSLYHFARAFTQSFGVPPHRYHMARRMVRAADYRPGEWVLLKPLFAGYELLKIAKAKRTLDTDRGRQAPREEGHESSSPST